LSLRSAEQKVVSLILNLCLSLPACCTMQQQEGKLIVSVDAGKAYRHILKHMSRPQIVRAKKHMSVVSRYI
jgi:hypothetical protein